MSKVTMDFRSHDNDIFRMANPDDVSFRRQSIASLTWMNEVGFGNSTMCNSINHFDAISENYFEAAFNAEKFQKANETALRSINDQIEKGQKENDKLKSSYGELKEPHLKFEETLELTENVGLTLTLA